MTHLIIYGVFIQHIFRIKSSGTLLLSSWDSATTFALTIKKYLWWVRLHCLPKRMSCVLTVQYLYYCVLNKQKTGKHLSNHSTFVQCQKAKYSLRRCLYVWGTVIMYSSHKSVAFPLHTWFYISHHHSVCAAAIPTIPKGQDFTGFFFYLKVHTLMRRARGCEARWSV